MTTMGTGVRLEIKNVLFPTDFSRPVMQQFHTQRRS